MKKQILAIIFLLASLLSTSVRAEQKNGWYFGANIGLSHFNPFKYFHKNIKNVKEEDIKEENIKEEDIEKAFEYFSKRDKPSIPIIGFFLGYEFNPYLGLELKNTANNFFPHKALKKMMNFVQPNTFELTTKLAYPITDEFNLYTKLGGTIFWDELLSKHHLKQMFTKQTSLYPTVSLGAEYVFNKKLITRLDYTWKNKVEKIIDSSIKPSLGNLTFSLGWKFSAPHIRNIFPSYNKSFLDKEYNVLRENINFPFNSASLKPISCDKLNKLDEDIKRAQFENISIVLSGHADRIGSTEYNQKLSEDRAYNIKNYLTSKGFSRDKITVQGMGDLYPLTNQVCKDIKNRSLLISCLAPDRRVEIEVSSNSK